MMGLVDIFRKKTTPALTGGKYAPIEEGRYVVIDTELTGLDRKRDSIISIGAVKMVGARIELGDTFYRLINPETEMKSEGIFIHGITPSEVAERPVIDKVICELIDFCGNDVIVGHFISLDMSFINRDMKRVCGAPLYNPTVDTCRIYERIRMNSNAFSRDYAGRPDDLDLFTLAREYQIPVSEGHNALGDAFITAQLFQRFLSLLPALGVRTLRDLMRVGKP